MFALSFAHFVKCTFCAFRLRKVSSLTSKQLSAKHCSNVIMLRCAAETERVQVLMRTLDWTDFKSI